jgi:hypothetical protein
MRKCAPLKIMCDAEQIKEDVQCRIDTGLATLTRTQSSKDQQELHRPGVDARVTPMADSDEILCYVFTGMTAKLLMMNFEVRHYAAVLTSPIVPPENLMMKLFVGFAI